MFGYELAWSIFVYFTSPLLISSPQQVVPFYSPVLAFMRTFIRDVEGVEDNVDDDVDDNWDKDDHQN